MLQKNAGYFEQKGCEERSSKKEKALKRQQEAAAAAALAAASIEEADPLSGNYGEWPKWTEIGLVNESLKNKPVLVRGRIHTNRPVGKNIGFLVLREEGFTIQCVLTVAENLISRQMAKFATSLSKESIVDIQGIVSVPDAPIKGATQQVELQVRKIYAICKAVPTLPLNIVDATRSEADIEKALQDGGQIVRVNQDTRLNFRVLDMRTPANLAIFRIQSHVEDIFREFLKSQGFFGIHTPKLIEGTSEGGASVFELDYFGTPACLAQSPQLYKQMAICGDFRRIFEIGSVFRAEKSSTPRHVCEFIGLDVEMEFKEDYSEVMDVVDGLFVAMFDSLNKNCQKELEAIGKQYPFEPLKYLRETPRLTFEERVQMLKEAGVEVESLGDLNIEMERKLGKLSHGIDLKSIESYIDAFRYATHPHGGFGVGLERIVMLFCGLKNIRKTSLFPHDPQRITP
ncbi:hypothetical protein MKW98_029842 [Papaver atlanticum]|uniref:aspartate--tRNA ligase n=1 Tax=Papaver atlanticum TaxID=357466 RepID=A0AAD4TL89_9MAGN|nr:hypothetical protein MKW98_029842 [Papaver atlanticum]